MAESNFHHRHKPGVRQRHNTALEHKIVRNVILRPPKAPEPEPEPELSTPVVAPPITEENKKRAHRLLPNQRTKKRREERKRQKARKEEAEIVANYTQDAGFTLGETLLASLLKNGDS